MSIEAMKQAYAVPLIEQLESVPADARMMYEHDKFHHENIPVGRLCHEAATALRQAIEQAEKQEPVVGTKTWFEDGKMVTQHLYASDISQERVDETAKCGHDWGLVTDDALIEEVRRRGFTIRDAQISSKREWVGLTDEEILKLWGSYFPRAMEFYQAIEAKLKEKNA